jgi:hypothetical protein
MGMALAGITKAGWETKKKAAGIKSAKWYEKAHADVGGYIAKFQKARANYKAAKNAKTVKEYNSALVDLDKAFGKFLAAKEFKTDLAEQLQKDILQWQIEVQAKSTKLKKFYAENEKKLEEAGAEQLLDDLDKWGL